MMALDEHLVLGQIVHVAGNTVYLEGKAIGLIDYYPALDAYRSNVDPDPRSLADQLELLVRAARRGVR